MAQASSRLRWSPIVPGSPSLPLSATDRGRASCRHSRVVADFGIGSLNPLHDPPARIEHAGEMRSRIASETTYGGPCDDFSNTIPGGREDRRRSRSPMRVEEVGFARDRRWREMDSNLYGAFPVKRLFWVVLTVFCSERERPFFVPSPAIRFAERADGVKGPKR